MKDIDILFVSVESNQPVLNSYESFNNREPHDGPMTLAIRNVSGGGGGGGGGV